jgi:hypothetical protein
MSMKRLIEDLREATSDQAGANVGNRVEFDEGIGDGFKSAVSKIKSMFGRKGDEPKPKRNDPDYWRTIHGQHIGFDGKPGSGDPVVGPKQIVSKLQGKSSAKSAPASSGGGGSSGGNVDVTRRNIEPPSSSTKRSDGPLKPKYMTYDLSKEATAKRRAAIEAKLPPTPLGIDVGKTTKAEREANDWLYAGEKDHPNRPVAISDKDREDLVAMAKKIDPKLDIPFDDLEKFKKVQSRLITKLGEFNKNHSDKIDALRKIRAKHKDAIEGNRGFTPLTQDEVDEIDKADDESEQAAVEFDRISKITDVLGGTIKKNKR